MIVFVGRPVPYANDQAGEGHQISAADETCHDRKTSGTRPLWAKVCLWRKIGDAHQVKFMGID